MTKILRVNHNYFEKCNCKMDQNVSKYTLIKQRKLFECDSELVVFGYIRHNITKDINPNDIATIIIEHFVLRIDWKFDYFYDHEERGAETHGIDSNGKKLFCNCSYEACRCFFCSYSFGMKPQSGKYDIKIKCDYIHNDWGNMIGIVSQHSKNNKITQNSTNNDNDNYRLSWYNQLNDYIGWSASDDKTDKWLPNGLYCGANDTSIENNIFRKNNFVYKSNNENYKQRLPEIEKGDIIHLSYDSNNGILSFSKENDNGKLDAQISNLPTINTYYWFVAHYYDEMRCNVIED